MQISIYILHENHDKRERFLSSAPGAYCPEKVRLDPSLQFSFGLRPIMEKPNDTPGIHITYISFFMKRKFLDTYFSNLAPGTYSPEKINLNKGPQYSLSGKGSVEKPINTPGR
jgi:hypothetical protein